MNCILSFCDLGVLSRPWESWKINGNVYFSIVNVSYLSTCYFCLFVGLVFGVGEMGSVSHPPALGQQPNNNNG